MTKLFTRNSKLAKSSAYTVNFGIPALKTCPMAKQCKEFCYANKGAYAWPVVKNAYNYRFECTKLDTFPQLALSELSKIKKLQAIRIHDAGDFYNRQYLHKWRYIAESMPEKIFYFYTKRVSLVKGEKLPSNMKVIYSLGGKEDNLINTKKDRHSRIFKSLDELKKAGYIDASHDDTIAWQSTNNKIGLVIH